MVLEFGSNDRIDDTIWNGFWASAVTNSNETEGIQKCSRYFKRRRSYMTKPGKFRMSHWLSRNGLKSPIQFRSRKRLNSPAVSRESIWKYGTSEKYSGTSRNSCRNLLNPDLSWIKYIWSFNNGHITLLSCTSVRQCFNWTSKISKWGFNNGRIAHNLHLHASKGRLCFIWSCEVTCNNKIELQYLVLATLSSRIHALWPKSCELCRAEVDYRLFHMAWVRARAHRTTSKKKLLQLYSDNRVPALWLVILQSPDLVNKQKPAQPSATTVQ